jgi:hypothetical protein
VRALCCLALLGCAGEPEPEPAPVDSEVTEASRVFSFVVIADPHITSDLDRQERLAAAVAWVDAHVAEREIALAVVVGDVGWHGGLPIARGLLDELDVPYLPLIGDNEVYFGEEEQFSSVFAPVYEQLAGEVDGLVTGVDPVYDPVNDRDTWLFNAAFSFRGVRFVGLDWASRDSRPILSEGADLHDYAGGTWPWFEGEVGALQAGEQEDVLLFSHHPMNLSPAAFDLAELGRVTALTGAVGGRIAGAWAGHLHVDLEERVPDAGYDVHVTDATWDDEVKLRVVEVWQQGDRFSYAQELVLVP